MDSLVSAIGESYAPNQANDWRMRLTGKTLSFAVLGHPVGHSLSPAMQNSAFAAQNVDAVYLAHDVHPTQLKVVIPALGDLGYGGVNLTLPHKQIAYRELHHLDQRAKELGAVNTVKFTKDGPVGYNTDGEGFINAVREKFGRSVEDVSVFVYGCGGAGRAVAITCARSGASRVILANRTVERAQQLASEISLKFPKTHVTVCGDHGQALALAKQSDLVVQATVIGLYMNDASSILPSESFREGQWAVDLEYTQDVTPFMKAAMDSGAVAVNGLGMLLHQGALAYKIWTEQDAPIEVMRDALIRAIQQRDTRR